MPIKGWVLVGVAAAIVLLLAGGAYYVYRQNNPDLLAAQAATMTAANLPPDRITPQDMVMGSAKAPVTMIEYYAQACSYCAQFDQNVFPQIKAKYIDTGKLRYVMRLYPLFPVDGPAYKLTRCVAPEKYFQAVDLMFRNQPQWDNAEFQGVDTEAGLMKMARILGMNDEEANRCMHSTSRDAAINQTAQEGQARYAIQGTPTFVMNFRKVDMPQQSWQEAQAAIDAALGSAK